MQLGERHIIKREHKHYQEIDRLCWLSKNFYNGANCLIGQKFINKGVYIGYKTIQKTMVV